MEQVQFSRHHRKGPEPCGPEAASLLRILFFELEGRVFTDGLPSPTSCREGFTHDRVRFESRGQIRVVRQIAMYKCLRFRLRSLWLDCGNLLTTAVISHHRKKV